MGFRYPRPRRDDSIVDCYHGTNVYDPYRWMEDPDSEETKAFVDAENEITRAYIDSYPARQEILDMLTGLINYTRYSNPFKRGDKFFYFQNTGLQNQNVLYVQKNIDGQAEVFLDPNELSPDGTIALVATSFSDDGSIMAYSLSDKGSDWFSIHFKDVATRKDYADVLTQIKYTNFTWTFDNKGVFYGKCSKLGKATEGKTDDEVYAKQEKKLYYHVLGTDQNEDIMVFEYTGDPTYGFTTDISECGRYLFITPWNSTQGCALLFCDLQANGKITGKLSNVIQIVTKPDYIYSFITNENSNCIFMTNFEAPNTRLILIDLMHPEKDKWSTFVPEQQRDVLEWAACVNNNKLVICYTRDVKNVLELWSIPNKMRITTFPMDIGTIWGFSGRKKDTEIFYTFASSVVPSVIYRCDLTTKELKPKIFREVRLEGYDPSSYKLEQVFYRSKDCTKIPMFISCRKNAPRDGSDPCILTGYGGFNISLMPSFSSAHVGFMQYFKGSIAVANIRGGGEYGENWHDAGRLLKKQNVFDDFCAAAEYLVQNGYTSKNKLIIKGGSNGGLLVGACINQRPELFGAAIANVGVMDMLRFHKFTIGYAWVNDYGSSDDPKHFNNLLSYSPLHNIKAPADAEHQYPATIITTADHDDRVVPLHSLKFIATLHHALNDCPYQQNPVMIRVETKAGHGGGKPISKHLEEIADELSFVARSLHLNIYPPKKSNKC